MQALTITNLKKTYQSGKEALKGVSLTVEKGDFYALLGPNGAGKSTLISIVSGLIDKTEGSVTVFDASIDEALVLSKTYIGLVPQEFNFNIFETVLNTIVYQAGYYGIERKEALVRAEKYLKKLGLWEKRNEPGRALSGGMKRRLMIARALIHEPKLLILDEPTAGVDIELRRGMWDFLRELNENGTTIIMTTHYLEEAEQLCRNVAIIDNGSIIASGPIKKLLLSQASETFILDLTGAPEKKVFEALSHLQPKPVDEASLEITVPIEQTLNTVFEEISALGLGVQSMRTKSNRLEELFVRLTQKK